MSRGSGRARTQRGAVTAELAVALPLLVAVTWVLAWLLSLGVAQVRVVDAAREAARAVARGDSEAEAVALGQRVAPAGARLVVRRHGDLVEVVASLEAPGPTGPLGRWGGVTLRASAVAAMEPGAEAVP